MPSPLLSPGHASAPSSCRTASSWPRSPAPGPATTRVPGALNAEYYRQRAGAGLIVSEAVAITPEAVGYKWTPGLWSDEQVAGWRDGHRRRARRGRPDRRPAVARRPDQPRRLPRRRAARLLDRPRRRGREVLHRRRLRGHLDPSPAAHRRDAAGGRGLPPGDAQRAGPPASTGSRCTPRTATCSSSSWPTASTTATTPTAARVENRSRLLLEVVDAVVAATGAAAHASASGCRWATAPPAPPTPTPQGCSAHLGTELDRRRPGLRALRRAGDRPGRRTRPHRGAAPSTWTGPARAGAGLHPRASAEQAVARGKRRRGRLRPGLHQQPRPARARPARAPSWPRVTRRPSTARARRATRPTRRWTRRRSPPPEAHGRRPRVRGRARGYRARPG